MEGGARYFPDNLIEMDRTSSGVGRRSQLRRGYPARLSSVLGMTGCVEIARVPRRAGLTHTTIGRRHSADSSTSARWSARRKPATAGSTTADPPQKDAYGMGGAADMGFDVTVNGAVLEIVSQY